MGFKRGQAAMEYLMTYGWAILVIVIVLAALLYLGIFNLNPPEVCTMPAGLSCTKNYLTAGTTVTSKLDITLVNGLQKTIVVTNMSCTKKSDMYEVCTTSRCINWVDATTQLVVPLGSQMRFNVTCLDDNGAPMAFSSGDAFSGKINVQYYFKDEGAGATRKITGNIYTKAG